METGIVVEESESQVWVWVNLQSLLIPVSRTISSTPLKIGTRVSVMLMSSNTEIMKLFVTDSPDKVTVSGKELRVNVRFIFPPLKLLSKIGLKLYSERMGLVSADESMRILFEKAARVKLVMYEGIIKWCHSSREFILEENQQLTPVGKDNLIPSYLEILKGSPWAELIEPPKTADEVLQNVMNDMIPSSSSSDDEHDAIPSDFARTGVLMERKEIDEWNVFILDADVQRNQWTTLTDRRLHRHSRRPFLGATVEIDLIPEINFKVEHWCVVDEDKSVISTRSRSGGIELDVAVRAEKIVRVGELNVTRFHNKRILDVYDYNNLLGRVEMGEVVRVVIKWSRLNGDYIKDRKEWVVSDYGKGEAVLPESKSEIRRRREIDQALKEFRFAEYATDERDWIDNQLLRKYKRILEESKKEDERREEERLKKLEEEKNAAEKEALIRHKSLDADADATERERQEIIRYKNAMVDEDSSEFQRQKEELIRHKNGMADGSSHLRSEREEMINHKNSFYSRDSSYARSRREREYVDPRRKTILSTVRLPCEYGHRSSIEKESMIEKESPIQTEFPIHNESPSHSESPSQKESPSNSTVNSTLNTTANTSQSSNVTQTTVIRRCLPTFGQNLNKTQMSQDLDMTGSSSIVSRDSRDSGRGSSSGVVVGRERRALALLRRMDDIMQRNGHVRSMIDRGDSDWIDDLYYVLDEYRKN